jgi:hypothetical protein
MQVRIEAEGIDLTAEVSETALNAVLFDFNPSAHKSVTLIKALHAALISEMENVRGSGTPAQARCASIAITELEGTQMRAVKALFAK